MSFGSRLRNTRIDRDFTQEQMAELIPMNQSNYSKLERDIQEPNLFQLKRISEILNISLDTLLDVDNQKTAEQKDIYFLEEIKSLYKKFYEK